MSELPAIPFLKRNALQMTSLGFSVLFSNTRRFLAVQIHQQTHVKMLTDTPVGGRQVSAEEVPRACSKVLVG